MTTTQVYNARLCPLVAAYYQTGDERLLNQVLTALRPYLLRQAQQFLAQRDERWAEDVAQEALLSLTLKLREQRFSPANSLIAFARVICQAECVMAFRRRRRQPAQPGAAEHPFLLLSVAGLPEDRVLGREYQAQAAAALSATTEAVLALDSNARTAVVLYFYKGLSSQVAAAQLRIEEAVFRRRLQRGITSLRSWGEQHGAPDAEVYATLPGLDTGNLFTEPLRLAS